MLTKGAPVIYSKLSVICEWDTAHAWWWPLLGSLHRYLITPVKVMQLVTTSHNCCHFNDVMISAMVSQLTSVSIVYSAVCSYTDCRKRQSPASLAFVMGIHRSPVISPHKWPVAREKFPFDDVIMGHKNGPVACDWYVNKINRTEIGGWVQ